MNFKRGRCKNRRAGCLLCKPHKANGADRRTVHEQRADEAWNREMADIAESMLPLVREAITLAEESL